MKNAILLLSMVTLLIGGVSAQVNYDTVTATYSAGILPASDDFIANGDESTCPGMINVALPPNAIAVSVDVAYDITAVSPARMSDARSQLWCTSPNGLKEPAVYFGTGSSQGTQSYSRTGLDIVYGLIGHPFGFGLDFELHVGNNHYQQPAGCSPTMMYVNDGTWTVSIIYLPAGSPGLVYNPYPADEQLIVDIDDDLTWNFGSNTNYYDVYFGTDNPPMTKVVDNMAVGGSAGTFDPGTMAPNTEYFWQVVARNGVNDSPGPVWSFTTACNALSYPYFENFDALTTPAIPDCWVVTTNKPENQYVNYVTLASTYQSYSPPNYSRFASGDINSTDDSLFLVFPKVGTISDKMISLYVKNPTNYISGSVYEYPMTIGTITDPFDYSTFTPIETIIPGGNWEIWEVFFANYAGSDQYIALLSEPDNGNQNYLEDVTIDLLPSCIKPLDLIADEVQANQATISWTELNNPVAGVYNIAYNDGVTFDTIWGATTNPATITGMTSATYYDVYVQADCGGDGSSDWSWPITILTECLPYSIPFSEDFGSGSPAVMPLCWNTISETSYQYGGVGSEYNQGYTGNCVWMDNGVDSLSTLILVAPEVDALVDINTLRLTFWAEATTPLYTEIIVGTMTDPADKLTFTAYDTVPLIGGDEVYNLYKVYFHNYSGSDHYIAFKHNSEYKNTQLHIDDVTVEAIPACVEPYQLYVDGPTSNSAMLNWTDPMESATNWEIEIGTNGFTPGTGAATLTYSPSDAASLMHSYEMTGLIAATLYDVYVRTDCGGSYSIWEGPVTFQSGFANMTLPYAEGFEAGMGTTANDYLNGFDWIVDAGLQHSGSNSIWADPPTDNNLSSILKVTGIFDLTAKANQMLTFWQIPKVDGNNSHCYVEISTDGGTTFDQLPVSTYFGGGNYYEPTGNSPEGPCFDEDSYPDFGTGNQIPDNTWWKKEYFDLSDYSAYDNVVFRFRLKEYYTNKAGWWIDDIAIEYLGAPDFSFTPLVIDEDASTAMPVASLDITTANTGSFPAAYTASVVYDETVVLDENFDAGVLPAGWSVEDGFSDGNSWIITNNTSGYSFDGTYHASVKSPGSCCSMDEGLITPVVDLSSYSYAILDCFLAFDRDTYNGTDTAIVQVYDGANWVDILRLEEDFGKLTYIWPLSGAQVQLDLTPYLNPNLQVKFLFVSNPSTYYFAVDDVKIRASMTNPIGWLKVDGIEEVSKVALPDTDGFTASAVNVTMDATGLAEGTYTADILVTSGDAGNPSTTIPVTFNVVSGSTLSGNITYANTGMTPLENCTVELRNATDEILFTTTTDATGYYEFTGLLDGDYTIQTTYTNTWGGMTTFDATLILRFAGGVAGYDMLTNLQKRAADVNMTNTADGVTTFDATLILRTSGAGGVKPAQWIAPDYIFDGPYPDTPALGGYPVNVSGGPINVDIQGSCSGDVNASYTPPAE